MASIDERQRMVDAAGEYAKIASEQLNGFFAHLAEEERKMELDKSCEELQIHFMFPNLYDYERYLLLALRFANRGVSLMVNTDQAGLTEEERHEHELGTSQIEELFVDARTQVIESGVLKKLSEVQMDIVKEDFLNVRFASVEV
jgi:hypothetical protein